MQCVFPIHAIIFLAPIVGYPLSSIGILQLHSSTSTSLIYSLIYSLTDSIFSYFIPRILKVCLIPMWKVPFPQVNAICSTSLKYFAFIVPPGIRICNINSPGTFD